jgi:ribosomal protein L7/L12
MNMRQILLLFFTILCVSSCDSGSSDALMMEMAEEMIPITRRAGNDPLLPLPEAKKEESSKKKIIKDGRIIVEVGNLKEAKHLMDSLLKIYDAYYANESYNDGYNELSYELTIRVPSVNFESLIVNIEMGSGKLSHKEIEARDVTDQFIDLESRLESKLKYLERYRELLKSAKTVIDILEIEEKIRVIEEEIDSTEGRLKYLNDLVGYSTLRLRLIEEKDIQLRTSKQARFALRFKHAISNGWFGFVDFLIGVLQLWPFAIVIGILYPLIRSFRRRRKGNK